MYFITINNNNEINTIPIIISKYWNKLLKKLKWIKLLLKIILFLYWFLKYYYKLLNVHKCLHWLQPVLFMIIKKLQTFYNFRYSKYNHISGEYITDSGKPKKTKTNP